jgi:hypothetical protein
MAEYVITPDKKEIPSSHSLTEELHRRSLSVEMEVHGPNYKEWENIYFFDPANAGTRCFLERNLHSLIYKITLPAEPTQESEELQTTLVEIILHEVGGKVFDPDTKKSFNLAEFRIQSGGTGLVMESNISSFSSPAARSLPPVQEMLWIGFSWALVLIGFYFYRHAPQPRKILMLAACGLALMSAVGITFSSLQSNERG